MHRERERERDIEQTEDGLQSLSSSLFGTVTTLAEQSEARESYVYTYIHMCIYIYT